MRYIVISGGGFKNTGAQAMTLTLISEIRQRYPKMNIVMLMIEEYDANISAQKYDVELIPWNATVKSYVMNPLVKFAYSFLKHSKVKQYRNYGKRIKDILNNAIAWFDISGFGLSSQINPKQTYPYILNIMVAKRYNVPIWLLPQSFGPFNYPKAYKLFNRYLVKKYLKYPTIIFIREHAGYKFLQDFIGRTYSNFQLQPDIVLQTASGYIKKHIFRSPYHEIDDKLKSIIDNIPSHSVAVIPNDRLCEYISEADTLELYFSIVNNLLTIGKTVYLIRHSFDDVWLVEKLYNQVPSNKNLQILNSEFSAIEMDCIIGAMEYIIGSRYHSLVHAFKNTVPSISIGWAIKYKELLNLFGMNDYNFDVREPLDKATIIKQIQHLDNNSMMLKNQITQRLKSIQHDSIFSSIKLPIDD